MRFPDGRLLIFARRPRAGEAKTRLIPRLGPEGAARLHAALVRRTLASASELSKGSDPIDPRLCPVELWCTPGVDDPFFADCAREFGVTLKAQRGEDLGARMRHALDCALRDATYAALAGTDCPGLSRAHFEEALQRLRSGSDAVFTPALDGGYVLIGLRRNDAALFRDIPWGTGEVMGCTRERLAALGWSWHETEPLRDIDGPEDLVEWERCGGEY